MWLRRLQYRSLGSRARPVERESGRLAASEIKIFNTEDTKASRRFTKDHLQAAFFALLFSSPSRIKLSPVATIESSREIGFQPSTR
jgi:hypothetical protein